MKGFKPSISSLFARGKRRISEAITSNPERKLGFSNGSASSNSKIQKASDPSLSLSRYGVPGFQNAKSSVHSFCVEDDDFSELGAPVPKEGHTHLVLRTERPKVSLNADASVRAAIRTMRDDKPKMKSLPPKHDKFTSAYRFCVDDYHDVSKPTKDAEHSPKCKGSNFIIIEKVPDKISLLQLRLALRVFGEISNVASKTGPDGFRICHVEFKTKESKDKAVASRGIFVKSFHLPIRNLHVEETITIRISNISVDTAESAIHSICMDCGCVEGLSKTKEGSVDVFFRVKDSSAKESILNKLNDMSVDDCQWSAEIPQEPMDSTIIVDSGDAQLGAGLHLTEIIDDIATKFNMKKMFLADLVNLQENVIHLQDHPNY